MVVSYFTPSHTSLGNMAIAQ